MLVEVQEDPKHPQRSRMVQKFSKFKCFKSSWKHHQCIELVVNFPTTQTMPQTEFVWKNYEQSNFSQTGQNQSQRGKRVTRGMTVQVTWPQPKVPSALIVQWLGSWIGIHWMNCWITCGIGEPMRGFQVVASHWPILVKCIKSYGVDGGRTHNLHSLNIALITKMPPQRS
jgi:hypothetical protein